MRIVTTPQPEITINHPETFLVTGRDGQVRGGRQGLYHRDTRYLSRYHFTMNGSDPVLLTANNVDFHLARFYFTNPRLGAFRTEVPPGQLLLLLDRVIDAGGMHEDWEITNHGRLAVRFTFALAFELDFEDLFEVRGGAPGRPRVVFREWRGADHRLEYRYRNRDFERHLNLRLRIGEEERVRYSMDRIDRDIVLDPRASWRMCVDMELAAGRRSHATCIRETGPHRLEPHRLLPMPSLRSNVDGLARAWHQAEVDLTSLHLERENGDWFPAAGVPWYATVFGRDPLIAGFELAHVSPGPARAALLRLADLQADVFDPWREAEPGKIPHELRVGELTHFRRVPYFPVYATADATLLYVIVLDETWRWTGDRRLLERCLPVAERCLEWARRFGDRDGDGLQEYLRHHGGPGYEQMGWKDSSDSVVHTDGAVAEPPIALVELQGYWFDALLRMAEMRAAVGGESDALRAEAEELRSRVEERFWMEDEGTYAFALDGSKRQVRGIASNPGHLLWSGLPSPERARRSARRLLATDMWTGWGIRTLSDLNPAYNPISYHRGSVWPHDNALIAQGFRRYGLFDSCAQIAEGIFAAAARFEGSSLPELWSGVPRLPAEFPVVYLDANRPQAWAAGAVPLLLRSLLGLEADPLTRRLSVAPALPGWMGELELEGIPVFGGRVHLWAAGDSFEVRRVEGDVEVVRAGG